MVYNSIITNTQNKIKFGLNYTSDVYDEILNRRDVGRKDNSFGGFFEYSFDNFNNLNFVAGLRYDTHNNMGSFFTPRFHLRYTPLDRLLSKPLTDKEGKLQIFLLRISRCFFPIGP